MVRSRVRFGRQTADKSVYSHQSSNAPVWVFHAPVVAQAGFCRSLVRSPASNPLTPALAIAENGVYSVVSNLT